MPISRAGQHPVDTLLSRQAAEGIEQPFLVDQGVLPQVDVGTKSGTWMADSPSQYNNITGTSLLRARGDSRQTLNVDDPNSGTFNIEIFAGETKIDLQHDPLIDQMGMLELRRSIIAARAVKLDAEVRLSNLLFAAGTGWVNSGIGGIPGTGGNQWNVAGSTPLSDMNSLAGNLFHIQSFGEKMNTIVFGYDVAVALNASEEVRGYAPSAIGNAAGVGSRVLSSADNFAGLRAVISDMLGVPAERVFIGGLVRDTADPAATDVPAALWSDQAWFGKMDLKRPMVSSAGNVVSMGPTAAIDFSGLPFAAGRWDSPDRLQRNMFAEQGNDYVAVNTQLGYLLTDVLL